MGLEVEIVAGLESSGLFFLNGRPKILGNDMLLAFRPSATDSLVVSSLDPFILNQTGKVYLLKTLQI